MVRKNKGLKGIILAGGEATRLYPITSVVSKQLLPIYDKPMIYYPLSTLMLAGIRNVLIISTPKHLHQFQELLGNGSHIGMKFQYAKQNKPRGIADAFIVGEKFIGSSRTCLVLGDNIFHSHGLTGILQEASKKEKGAIIFGTEVKDPERYGIVEFNYQGKAISLEEKPKEPKSNYAIVGLYFYDNSVIDIAKSLNPSSRGEIEITDINKIYLKHGDLEVKLLGRGSVWLDTGTFDSMANAGEYIRVIQERSGQKIACIEEIAYRQGFINRKQLVSLAREKYLISSGYGEYLLKVSDEKNL